MKHILRVLVLSLFGVIAFEAAVVANESKSASEIMMGVWGHFGTPEIKTEIERSKMISTNWTTPEKFCTRWVKYKEKELMLVLNNSARLEPKSDGTLIQPSNAVSGFSVLLQKRKEIKIKSSDFDNKSNGTEFNYIDIYRLMGENPEEFSYTFWDGKISDQFRNIKISASIKCVNRRDFKEDYPYRIFHIVYLNDNSIPAIKGVEYFCSGAEPCKIMINDSLEWNKDYSVWRANSITLLSYEAGTLQGKTTFELLNRVFNQQIGKIDKKALMDGDIK
ncbi:MAG TPA: hypothetical protein ACFYEF_02815 [Candidatus Wunengus sp. YC63]|uniref:hypothetical protein n=1 Tax=Candidatus Wunengus sp. YC63 TaxID=3367699 RepID=UPI004025246B